MAIGIILLVVCASFIVLLALSFAIYYNRFIVLENRIDNALAQIDVQLKKRSDLVPNLLNSVKGYMKHEKAVIKDVTDARKAILSAPTLEKRAAAGADLQNALKSIFALAENYPQLKASDTFIQLQNELSDIENKIAYSRQFYNDSIIVFNNSVETFPGVFFAKLFNKNEKQHLQIKQEERAVPKVEF